MQCLKDVSLDLQIYIYCIQATVPFEKQGVEVGDGFGVVVVITVGASSKR